jgi:hypothetical protein
MRENSRIIWYDVRALWNQKGYAASVVLVTALSYGILWIRPAIGIDDTSFSLYFEEGVAPAVGRWCLYLLHKIFPLAYNPYVVEGVGLLLFCLSATLWCVLFRRLMGSAVSARGGGTLLLPAS